MLKSYSYDRETGVFIRESCYTKNHKNEPIIAAFETIEEPPKVPGNQVARYLDEEGNVPSNHNVEGNWVIHENLIGTEFYEKSGLKRKITEYNEVVPEEALLSEPPEFSDTHDGKNWIIDIEKMRVEKIKDAALIRKEIEISGIEITGISCDNFNLDTDDAGQTKVTGAYILAKDNVGSSDITKWYTLSGWRDVTNADIVKMGEEANIHVKKTFEEMERIETEINALSTTVEIENYNIEFNMS
ncbi:MAG: DUF4376 domain-containing protein [Desulfobacterales bacterium]|nr:DUF4376 domain-containing protein [Desulfobacterales bacterium]